MFKMLTGILWIALGFPVMGQGILEIDDRIDERNLMLNQLLCVPDSANTLSFEEVSAPSFADHFRRPTTYQNRDFRANVSYWIKLPVRHTTRTEKLWLLEFYDQTIDYLDAWIPLEDGTYRLTRMGDRQPFGTRHVPHKNFEMVLDMKTDTLMCYYFRVQSHDFADIRIGFRSVNRFVYYALNEYFLFGTFYGMILIITLYNFLVFLAIREVKNIYYILYLLSVAAYAMSYDGIGFQFLWPNRPEWNDYAVGITLYAVILWSLVFTRRFLRTKTLAPGFDLALRWMIVLRSAFFLAELFLLPQLLTYRNVEIIPLSLIFLSSIVVWKRGYRPARFFVMAYGFLFCGFFIRSLVYFNILPFTTPLHYSLHFSFVLEMLFLTFALGDRIRILKAMRDRVQKRIIREHEVNMELKDKVNRELEQKVLERTIELNTKNAELERINEKLERQSREINQINSILDLDNWKLKNSIREVLNERLMEKTMDYRQFMTLYPDALSCYRFLESLKWEGGFVCRKCGNEKYFEGSQKFARRCTRCGYNESVTSFTIFHSLKFPIEKAFYIAYLVVAAKNGFTLDALSTQLGLRLNTVWGFRRKVQQRIDQMEKRGRRPTVSRWEEVIVLPADIRKRRTGATSPGS